MARRRLGLAVFGAIIALSLIGLPAAAVAKSALSPADLRCEYPARSSAGITFLRMADHAAVCEVGSGNYEFSSSLH
ncbi:MAG: hypothetical protein WCK27_08290 [Verrucomicrobiota bacterium]